MSAPRRREKSKAGRSLRDRLWEAEEALAAIRSGAVDSILVEGSAGPRVYSLEGSEAMYRQLIEGMSEGAASLDRNGIVTYCNRRFAQMANRPLPGIMGAPLLDILPEDERRLADRFLKLAWRKGGRKEMNLPADGGSRSVLVSATPVNGEPPFLCLVVTDLEEQRRAESERLARALDDARLRGLSDRINEIELVTRRDGALVHANDRAVAAYGYPRRDLLRLNLRDLHTEEARSRTLDRMGGAPPSSSRFETTHVRRDGSSFPVRVSSRRFTVGGKQYLHSIIQDLTESHALERGRLQAQRALLESQARLAAFVERVPVAIAMFDQEMRYLAVSQRWISDYRLGDRELLGHSHFEVFPDLPERWKEIYRRCLRGAVERNPEDPFPRSDGTVDWVRWEIRPWHRSDASIGGIVVVAEIINDWKTLNERMAQSGRLAALGTLVAGVAHEVNNPLAGVTSSEGFAADVIRSVRAALRDGSPVDPAALARELDDAAEALDDAQAAGLRVARIVREMTLFARPNPEVRRTSLRNIVDQAMQWLPGSVSATSGIRVEHREVAEVLASQEQMSQVIINLVTNAAKAMPAGHRGSIIVRTGPGAEGMARMEVQDDGVGIRPEVLERVFDPFFSTRLPGEGLGLGLAVVHSIVTSAGGTITARSEPGRGSTFTVELRVAEDASPPGAPAT